MKDEKIVEGPQGSPLNFAKALVFAHEKAVTAYLNVGGGENMGAVLAAREDLLQALTVPKQVDEDFPTVRDTYIQAALTGILANGYNKRMPKDGVEIAHRIADAAMAARKVGQRG